MCVCVHMNACVCRCVYLIDRPESTPNIIPQELSTLLFEKGIVSGLGLPIKVKLADW